MRAASVTVLPRQHRRFRLLSGAFFVTLLCKLVGLAVLLGASGLMYDLATSTDFKVNRVSVTGNRLLTPQELEAAAGGAGVNLFWVRGSDVSLRLRLLPPVETAMVTLELPDHLRIEIKERDPVAIWLAGETPFLVDHEGLVLAARPPEQQLLVIRDVSGQTVAPGQRVNADVVRGIGRVDSLLAESIGPQQRQYEYAGETGLNVVQAAGPRLVLGGADNLEWKVGAVKAIVGHLQARRGTAELIDVRFSDRPYYR